MRNAIKYYYNIEVENLRWDNHKYLFKNYVLLEYYKQLDLNIYYFCRNNNIYVHEIVTNVNNEYETFIDNKPYILLNMRYNIEINFNTISNYNIVFNAKERIDWGIMWSNKVDYYEMYFNDQYNGIAEILPYYIGMAEIAISLFKTLNLDEYLYISHSRLNNDIDFFNPLNLILDYKIRDITEYIKEQFFHNKNYESYLKIYIVNNYLSYNECMLILCRLLFPNYFFDLCDSYIRGIDITEVMEIFENKIVEYELFIKRIYHFIRIRFKIPIIDWLNA